MFKVNNRNARTRCEMFKVNNKDNRTTPMAVKDELIFFYFSFLFDIRK